MAESRAQVGPKLRAEVEALIANSGAQRVAVAYRDLDEGDELLLDAELPFHPASTFKLCVLMEVFRQASRGDVALDDRVGVDNDFESIADGSPYAMVAADDSETTLYERIGGTATIRDLAELMITQSSNLATSLLIRLVSADAVTAFMRDLGAPDLRVLRGPEDNVAYMQGLNNSVTAGGLVRILDRLARRELVSAEASEEMLAILRRQTFNEGIPAAVRPGTRVAHKTGWNERLYHDAAVVEPADRGPYVLVILTQGLEEAIDAPTLVREVTRTIFRGPGLKPGLGPPRPLLG
jgi:beta-lactamase class A